MGKWLAGIASGVIVGVVVWWVTGKGSPKPAPPPLPSLRVSAWYVPEPVEPGRVMEIFVRTLADNDTPIPGVSIKLTPVSGTFLWAGAGGPPIEGQSDQRGLFSTKFQTVVQVGLIGSPPPPNSGRGRISVFAEKAGYVSSRSELEVVAGNP